MIELVNQIDDKSCVLACLAMATGESIEKIMDIMGLEETRGISVQETIHALEDLGYMPNRQINTALYLGRFYILTVPSLNIPGGNHVVIYYTDMEGERYLLDPQQGREGKKYYTEDTLKSWSEPIEIIERSFEIITANTKR